MPKRPAVNEHGLDCSYNHQKLSHIKRDLAYYRPDEFARALVRLAMTADSEVAVNTVDGMRQEAGSKLCKES